MSDLSRDGQTRPSGASTLLALFIGLAGAVFIWIAAPLGAVMLGTAIVADGYLPTAPVFIVLVLVLGVNPVLRRFVPRLALGWSQLALVFGILLAACIAANSSFVSLLPQGLSGACTRASRDPILAARYRDAANEDQPQPADAEPKALNPPASLFPDPLGYEEDTPASSSLRRSDLTSGEPVPFTAWVRPLLSWSGFLVPWMLMMIALAAIALPQWRDNERLAFPLLTIQRSLIEEPEPGHTFAPIFRSPLFWGAVGIVFFLRAFKGIDAYFPGSVPKLDLRMWMYECFKGGPFIFTPWWVQMCPINFIFIGMAFFMPSRIGFSVWFVQIIYALYTVFRCMYYPPFDYAATMTVYSNGAFLALPVVVLWLGRQHWGRVFMSMFRPARNPEDRRYRLAGYAFAAGCAGMGGWLLWVGVLPGWALALVVLSVLYALGITRVVAETGVPLTSTEFDHTINLARILPVSWRNAASMYFTGIVGLFNSGANQTCAMTAALHGLALDHDASPARRGRLAALFLLITVVALVVAGGAYLYAGYSPRPVTADTQPAAANPTDAFAGPEKMLEYWQNGAQVDPPYPNRWFHFGFGAAVTVVLMKLCLISPRWPLHPIALLLGGMGSIYLLWFNVFLGWLAKVIILRYWGAKTFSQARPLFIGLIIGEVVALAFWGVLAGLLALLGLPFHVITLA